MTNMRAIRARIGRSGPKASSPANTNTSSHDPGNRQRITERTVGGTMWRSAGTCHSNVVPAQAGTQYSRGGCYEVGAPIARPTFTGYPLARGRQSRIACAVIAVLAGVLIALPTVAFDDKDQPIEQRRANYAPWSPDQMTQRRKEQGLIGPGTSSAPPAPAFPSYLSNPDSIEHLMPQARAAARQSGGRYSPR